MTTRTPLARAQGLGSAHSGVKHFWRQRVTAAALVPLSIWFVWAALSLIGADRQSVTAFLHAPLNAILMGLFVILAAVHMMLGLQMVIEDYVHREGNKLVLLLLSQAFGWAVAAASVYALAKIAF